MESVEKIVSIADKIYIGEEFSTSDLNYFYKYLKQAIPSWFVGDKDDCISELILKIKDGYDGIKKPGKNYYNINEGVGWKKEFIDNTIMLIALTMTRDAYRYYEGDDKDYYIEEKKYDLDNLETGILYNKIVDIIELIKPSYSKPEQDIIEKHILLGYPLVSIANEHGISLQLASLMKKRIIKRIKNCIDFRQENDINN